MTLEVRGKYLFFEHEKGKYDFVRIKNIISCWDEHTKSFNQTDTKSCGIMYVAEGHYWDVTVINHSAKEVLEKLTGKKGSD